MENTLIFKNETVSLTLYRDGYWLYDFTRGMNLAMRGKTEQEAFIEALEYYQKRLPKVELELKIINDKVSSFIDSFDLEDSF